MSEHTRLTAQWDEIQRLRSESAEKDREISNLRIDVNETRYNINDIEFQARQDKENLTREAHELAEEVDRLIDVNDNQDVLVQELRDELQELKNTVQLGDETVDALLKCYAACYQAGYEATQELVATREVMLTVLRGFNIAMGGKLISEEEFASMESKLLNPPKSLPDVPLPSIEDMKAMLDSSQGIAETENGGWLDTRLTSNL